MSVSNTTNNNPVQSKPKLGFLPTFNISLPVPAMITSKGLRLGKHVTAVNVSNGKFLLIVLVCAFSASGLAFIGASKIAHAPLELLIFFGVIGFVVAYCGESIGTIGSAVKLRLSFADLVNEIDKNANQTNSKGSTRRIIQAVADMITALIVMAASLGVTVWTSFSFWSVFANVTTYDWLLSGFPSFLLVVGELNERTNIRIMEETKKAQQYVVEAHEVLLDETILNAQHKIDMKAVSSLVNDEAFIKTREEFVKELITQRMNERLNRPKVSDTVTVTEVTQTKQIAQTAQQPAPQPTPQLTEPEHIEAEIVETKEVTIEPTHSETENTEPLEGEVTEPDQELRDKIEQMVKDKGKQHLIKNAYSRARTLGISPSEFRTYVSEVSITDEHPVIDTTHLISAPKA